MEKTRFLDFVQEPDLHWIFDELDVKLLEVSMN
jgi:hypothetical protein